MAGALKHKQRSQYRYHQSDPYRQFHLNAARVQERKDKLSFLDKLKKFMNKRTTNK